MDVAQDDGNPHSTEFRRRPQSHSTRYNSHGAAVCAVLRRGFNHDRIFTLIERGARSLTIFSKEGRNMYFISIHIIGKTLPYLFYNRHSSLSSSTQKIFYPQRPFWTSRGHRFRSFSPMLRPSFLSRIGSSIPTFHVSMLVDVHRIFSTHALALSAVIISQLFTQEKVPTILARVCIREGSNQHYSLL